MTGLFDLLARRFSQAPAILPRPRLRFEGAGSDAGLHEQIQESTIRAPDIRAPGIHAPGIHAVDRPRAPTRPDTPQGRTAQPTPCDAPKAAPPTDAPPTVLGRNPPPVPGTTAPPRPMPASLDLPPHEGPAPAAIPTGTQTAAVIATTSAPAESSNWQHSAMPPVADTKAQSAPQPVATSVAVTRAMPAHPYEQRDQPPPAAMHDDHATPRVEIHIGRIEVAAPKPTPTRPPAPAAQSTRQAAARPSAPARPGLTDYLGWKR